MLRDVLKSSDKATAFYNSLHPSVRRMVDSRADEISLDSDLYAIANNAMTRTLREFGGVFDDSETWPD